MSQDTREPTPRRYKRHRRLPLQDVLQRVPAPSREEALQPAPQDVQEAILIPQEPAQEPTEGAGAPGPPPLEPSSRTVSYFGAKSPNRFQLLFAGAYPECRERVYLGSPGCGKTVGLISDVNRWCMAYPGATWLLSRWTQNETASILRGDYLRETPPEILGSWIPDESRQWYRNGSSVYIHGLRPSDEAAQFGKVAGYSLSGVGLSQVEAFPQEMVEKLRERLRHPLPPRLLLAEGNLDLGESHWLFGLVASAQRLHERVYRSGPRLILLGNLEDNEMNLPPEYVAALKAAYPVGHPQYGPKVGGSFGSAILGAPVFEAFREEVHVRVEPPHRPAPVLEAFDFGISRPAIVWAQWLPGGRFYIHGEYMGDGTQLGEVIGERNAKLAEWFPGKRMTLTTADPTGWNRKDVGKGSIKFLQEHQIGVQTTRGANTPAARLLAIQRLSEWMSRRTKQGEAFGIHPRCRILIEALRSGYVKDPSRRDGMPLKDLYYSHLAECVLYLALAFSHGAEWTMSGTDVLEVRRLIREDRDPGEPKDEVGRGSPWMQGRPRNRNNPGGF